MEFKTIKGYSYVVTASTATTVTDSHGLNLQVAAGAQQGFVATGSSVNYSGDCTIVQVRGNFSLPPADGSGGGQIVIDPTPTQGSDNAVSSGGVYTALRELPAPLPTALTPTTAMRNSGVYTVDANATAQVYTAITLAANATAEIWLTCTSDDNSVALPGSTEGWIWLDAMPDMEAGKTYAVAARNVGNAVLARPIYEYTTPAQS